MNILNQIFSLIAILIFLVPNPALATEGACSWHDGVNCNAGPDQDGSVICNDGWRESSVRFSNSSSCNVNCPWGYTEEFKQMIVDCLNTDSAHTIELKQELTYWQAIEQQWKSERNVLYSDTMTSEDKSRVIGLNSQIQSAHDSVLDYEGYLLDSEGSDLQSCQRLIDLLGPYYCNGDFYVSVCPEHALSVGSGCECENGYDWNSTGDLCVVEKIVVPTIVDTQAPETADKEMGEQMIAPIETTGIVSTDQNISLEMAEQVGIETPQKVTWWGRIVAWVSNIFR